MAIGSITAKFLTLTDGRNARNAKHISRWILYLLSDKYLKQNQRRLFIIMLKRCRAEIGQGF